MLLENFDILTSKKKKNTKSDFLGRSKLYSQMKQKGKNVILDFHIFFKKKIISSII